MADDVILDVVGATEAHEILGVELQRISRWRRAGRLPPPYCDLRLSPVWVRKDIEAVRDGREDGFTEPPEVPPLLGTAEAALVLEVDKSQIARWRSKPTRTGPTFPEPAKRIKAGPLWRRSDVEAFKHERAQELRRQARRRRARERRAQARAEARAV